MPPGAVKTMPEELTHTALVPVIEQAGSAFTVTVLTQVLLQPLESRMVNVSVNDPATPAVTETV